MTEALGHAVEDANCRVDDVRTNTVTWKEDDVRLHARNR